LHLPDHLFDDVEGKGTTQNFNTKPNEKLHGPLKNYYRDCTNFKDVAGQVLLALSASTFLPLISSWNAQILKVDHNFSVTRQMCDDMSVLDGIYARFGGYQDADAPDDVEAASADAHICIGAKQAPCTFNTLPGWVCNHTAFTKFQTHLANFLQRNLPLTLLPDHGWQLRFEGHDEVSFDAYVPCSIFMMFSDSRVLIS
jgi:hypothetical protein